jgi:hypothetical protein
MSATGDGRPPPPSTDAPAGSGIDTGDVAPPATPPDPGAAVVARELAVLEGGEVVGVELCAATGLVDVVVRAGAETRALGVGIGPDAVGIGWLRARPSARSPRTHPLLAALRAHVLGKRIVAAGYPSGAVHLEVEGARLELEPGRDGSVHLRAEGADVLWPPVRPAGERGPIPPRGAASLDETGAALLARHETAVARQRQTALRRAFARRHEALSRRVAAVEGDLAKLDRAEALEKVAQLLVAQAAKVPRGAQSAVLDDWESGGTLEVTLDPARPAKAQAEAMFAKVRRARRGRSFASERLESSRAELRALEALRAELMAGEGDIDVALEKRARTLGVKLPDAQALARRAGSTAVAPRSAFHVFVGSGERDILVGRGGADNDVLTTRHARPHDLWLHAKSRKGAHVVVPLQKGESCPPELLADAATLAAHFSDSRGEAASEVQYAERRHVRKRRKSAPGEVVVDREKVIVLRLEPARLARLLAARGDAPGRGG